MNSLLKMKNVSKKYKGKTILENINLTINEGNILAVTGGNGSGKSTLLTLMAGLNIPTTGSVIHSRENVTLGYVPDIFPDNIKFTIREYIHFLAGISGLSKVVIHNKLEKLIKIFDIEAYTEKNINTFSKGMKQKVNIMQGMIHSPRVLILDEPLAGLDDQAQQELKNIIKSLHREGVTIVFTSHEKEFIEDVSNRIITIEEGSALNGKDIINSEAAKVEITFSMETSLIKEKLLDHNVEEKKQQDSRICSVLVKEEERDRVLKTILQNKGSVYEVKRKNGVELF